MSPEQWLATQTKQATPTTPVSPEQWATTQPEFSLYDVAAQYAPPPVEPSTTPAGVAGAVTRGLGPYAAAATVGAALGAPIGGVGAIPGAAAGVAAMGLTQLVGDPVIGAINSMFGTTYTLPTDAMEHLLTKVGVPEPRTAAERVIQTAAMGASGGGAGVALGKTMMGASAPLARNIGGVLAAQAPAQVVGGLTGGASAGTAREMGAGPVGQIVAGLVGGVGGGAAAARRPIAIPGMPTLPSTVQPGSAGAAATPEALRRTTTARAMPVPFEGKSGLTVGQATRDFAQLQFEKESAKLGKMGTPLRERVSNQTATMLQNFDAMIDNAAPLMVDKADIGREVTQAIVNKAGVMRGRIRAAYTQARDAGEMQAPVEMSALPDTFVDLNRFTGVSPNISAINKEAQRLGAIVVDQNGGITPGMVSIDAAELLRQFANKATNWMDARESAFAKQIIKSIDESTEGQGGELYRAARKMRSQYANEFENTGLVAKLMGTKGKTNERSIAAEQVFDKVIRLSPVEEMQKVRSTLLRAGPEGKQAWADLKAKGIDHIKESSLSPSQLDEAGQPLLSPDKLNRVIKTLDETGKLEALYGPKQAQQLRDLAELSSVIYTAPPGAINTSNTASAITMVLDTAATGLLTGIPAPAATAIRESMKYIKNHKVRARIDEALKGAK